MEIVNNNYDEQALRVMAEIKVRKLKRFYTHLFIYAIALAFYFINKYANAAFKFHPVGFLNGFVISIWTAVIFVKAIRLYATTIFDGSKWEERQIRKMIEKDKIN